MASPTEACRRCGAVVRSSSEGDLCPACLMELGVERSREGSLAPGARLGPYEIIAAIGAGGMGEVYRARDERLKRDVAVKVLPDSFSADPDRLRRFEKEAQAASALNHPNIMAVYDVGTHEGAPYLVTELLEGVTLRDRLAGGRLSVSKAVEYASQIARGLAAAHAKGIVHRDLKPENLFVTHGDHVKILDFGVAKLIEAEGDGSPTGLATASRGTEPGVVLGTVAYMSPEQVKGQAVDGRSDIFSFGAILYEMLAGQQAFRRGSAAETMAAILKEEPSELSESGRKVPPALDHIVRHCLEKDPHSRFQSASDIAFNLSGPSSPMLSGTAAFTAETPAKRRGLLIASAIAALVVGASFFLYRQSQAPKAPVLPRVAVLPFENLGAAEDDYFADGIADAVRGKLTSVPGVQVIARGSSTPYKKTTKTPGQIARELDVRYLLTATVRWQKGAGAASRVEVSPELVEVPASGAPTSKWQEPFDASLTDVFQVQSQIATQVAQALGGALGAADVSRLAETPTAKLDAYDAFLKGEGVSQGMAIRNIPSLRRALMHYEQAVALDPGFAQAWARVSEATSDLYSVGVPTPELAERARTAAEKAVALAPDHPEGYTALGQYESIVPGDFRRALDQYGKGRRIAPGHAGLLGATARVEESLGRWDEALDHLRQAVRLDPRSVLSHQRLGAALFHLRRFPESRAVYDRGLSLAPSNLDMIESKVTTFLGEGDLAAARGVLAGAPREVERPALVAYLANSFEFAWVLDVPQRELLLRLSPSAFDDDRAAWGMALANASALTGDRAKTPVYAEESRKAFEQQLRAAPENAQLRVLLGVALAYLGRKEEAIQEGERAAASLPMTKDAVWGAYMQYRLIRVYVLAGEAKKALDSIESLLKVPSLLSPGWLRVDPNLEPLRGNPRFQKLAAQGA